MTEGKRPKLLDLFCGAGGAAMGYHRAGFEVLGVDIAPQKRFPFEFVQADALEFAQQHGHEFDVIHASPPCQAYSRLNRGLGNAGEHPDLVAKTRSVLIGTEREYVIENVVGAPLVHPLLLCGSMFGLETSTGLWLRRHRLFECSTLILGPECRHPYGRHVVGVYGGGHGVGVSGPKARRKLKQSIGVYGGGTNSWHREQLGRNITECEKREAMGIEWMTRKELSQAIPPAYTLWIGRQLLRAGYR